MWVDPNDVKDRFIGGDIPATDQELTVLIGDAEDAILRDIPDLQDRVEAGDVPEGRVKRIVARMVIRHVRNPDGYRSVNTSTGPFGEGFTWAGDSPGEIEFTDRDKEDLIPGFGGQRFTQVDMTPEGAGYEAPIW